MTTLVERTEDRAELKFELDDWVVWESHGGSGKVKRKIGFIGGIVPAEVAVEVGVLAAKRVHSGLQSEIRDTNSKREEVSYVVIVPEDDVLTLYWPLTSNLTPYSSTPPRLHRFTLDDKVAWDNGSKVCTGEVIAVVPPGIAPVNWTRVFSASPLEPLNAPNIDFCLARKHYSYIVRLDSTDGADHYVHPISSRLRKYVAEPVPANAEEELTPDMYADRYVISEGYPWAYGAVGQYYAVGMNNEQLGNARSSGITWPKELWDKKLPKYRLVLERVR